MKIGIAGVSSTGKSTLAKVVAEQLNLPVILDKDIHTRCWTWLDERGLTPSTKFFPEMSREDHLNFERAMFSIRVGEETALQNFVADETPLDFLNYLYHTCAPYPDLISTAEVKDMVQTMWHMTSKYDMIWYLAPGQIPVEHDNRRFTNEHLLAGWDYTLRGLVGALADKRKNNRPVIGFLKDVPNLAKRVEIVIGSVRTLKQLEDMGHPVYNCDV